MLHLKLLDQSTLNCTAKTPAKTASPSFAPARAGARLSQLQGLGLSPPTPRVGGQRDASPSGGNQGFPDLPNRLPAPQRAGNTLA